MEHIGDHGGEQNGRRIAIIGGGIAGLCAAVYGLKCGYQVEVLEMHDMAGGLAMSWRRGDYTFETCLHWLLGSKPGGDLHAQWQEIFEIDRLTFVNPEEFVRIEDENGESLSIYTNVDQLEAELLKCAPRDATAIRDLMRAVRSLRKFKMIDPSGGVADNWLNVLRDAPIFPLLAKLSKITCEEYGSRFSDPRLRAFFGEGEMGKLSAIAMIFSLAWMSMGNAGYPIGGSQAVIRLMEEKIVSLGGRIRFGARVERILVEHGRAVGVELVDGTSIMADWVISAADGHSTIFEMLGGKYLNPGLTKAYEEMATFPSYLQVSLGVGMDLSGQPSMATRLLKPPLWVDPGTELHHLSFRFFNFDPTFAPAGKTAVTCFLPTSNFSYWTELRRGNPAGYRDEKHRVAEAVIGILAARLPSVRTAIEVVDVSTPASVIRYTGNWKGSMEGWLIVPGTGVKPLPNTLEGLRRFMMVGQWVMPGGGFPSGPMTARPALKAICKEDHVPFNPHAKEAVKPEPVAV